jgi:hypothetical protein
MLPENPKVRTIGGSACTIIPIRGATNANPAVFYAPRHGLQVGEQLALSTGTEGSAYWPNWLIDKTFAFHSVASVPDPDHFTISYGEGWDSSSYQPWDVAFQSGARLPSGTGAFVGQVFYQTNAPDGNTVWQWNGSQWEHFVPVPNRRGPGYASPVVTAHANCNWSYTVDQLGPAGSGSAHLWNASMDSGPESIRPNWRIELKPSKSNASDYFLNVITAADTQMSSPPAVSMIGNAKINGASQRQGDSLGVQIVDKRGTYVAIFAALPNKVANVDYAAPHAGAAKHVVTGLLEGLYTITQNGKMLPPGHAGRDGSITFLETGGGQFEIKMVPQEPRRSIFERVFTSTLKPHPVFVANTLR